MSPPRIFRLALVVSTLLPLAAAAQSRFSISNPLIKPASRALPAPAAEEGSPVPSPNPRVPVARPVPDGGGPAPLGATGAGGGGLPGQSPESAVREELSAYTVVAIVADTAVLRTQVGVTAAAPAGGGAGSGGGSTMAGGSGPAVPSAPGARQLAMRVRTGHPLLIAGTQVLPTVGVSTVEFRAVGGRGGLLFTAALDSQSPQAFVPTTREAMDPAVAARTSPTPLNLRNIGTGAAAGSGSAAGAPGSGTTSGFAR